MGVDEKRLSYSNTKPDASYLLKSEDIFYNNINSIAPMDKVALYQGDSTIYHGITLLRLWPDSYTKSNYLF